MNGTHSMDTPSLTHADSNDWNFVYQPAEDTFLLLDVLEKYLQMIKTKAPLVVLEVGSGSGTLITALSKALGGSSCCLAVDINSHACHFTLRTSLCNKSNVGVLQGDLFTTFKEKTIDMVVFNPPYVVTPSSEITSSECLTKSWAGGVNGREVIDRFVKDLNNYLSENGFGFILLLKENDPDDIMEMLNRFGFKTKIAGRRKIRGEDLYVLLFEK